MVKRALTILLLLVAMISLPSTHERWIYFSAGKATIMLNPLHNLRAGGSGFQLATPEGPRIITNAHICKEEKVLFASTYWGNFRSRTLKVLKIDKEKDLCMLEGFTELKSLSLAWFSSKVLDEVFVVGHPALEALTISRGRVRGEVKIQISAFDPKELNCKGGMYTYPMCWREFDSMSTSAKIYGGNSGSPILNSFGSVVGVLFAGNPATDNGYFVPWRHLKEFVK